MHRRGRPQRDRDRQRQGARVSLRSARHDRRRGAHHHAAATAGAHEHDERRSAKQPTRARHDRLGLHASADASSSFASACAFSRAVQRARSCSTSFASASRFERRSLRARFCGVGPLLPAVTESRDALAKLALLRLGADAPLLGAREIGPRAALHGRARPPPASVATRAVVSASDLALLWEGRPALRRLVAREGGVRESTRRFRQGRRAEAGERVEGVLLGAAQGVSILEPRALAPVVVRACLARARA